MMKTSIYQFASSICSLSLIRLRDRPRRMRRFHVPRVQHQIWHRRRGLQEAVALPKIVEITSDSVGDIVQHSHVIILVMHYWESHPSIIIMNYYAYALLCIMNPYSPLSAPLHCITRQLKGDIVISQVDISMLT